MINGVYNALKARGLEKQVGIIADETSWIIQAAVEYVFWLPSVKDKIEAVAHHTYDFPIDIGYSAFRATFKAAFPNTPLWMTEVCCSLGNADGSDRKWQQGYDPT